MKSLLTLIFLLSTSSAFADGGILLPFPGGPSQPPVDASLPFPVELGGTRNDGTTLSGGECVIVGSELVNGVNRKKLISAPCATSGSITPENAIVRIQGGRAVGVDPSFVFTHIGNVLSLKLNPNGASDSTNFLLSGPNGTSFDIQSNTAGVQNSFSGNRITSEYVTCTDFIGLQDSTRVVFSKFGGNNLDCSLPTAAGSTIMFFEFSGNDSQGSNTVSARLRVGVPLPPDPTPVGTNLPMRFHFCVGQTDEACVDYLTIGPDDVRLPQLPNCPLLGTSGNGKIVCSSAIPAPTGTPKACPDPNNQYISGVNADGSLVCSYFCPTPTATGITPTPTSTRTPTPTPTPTSTAQACPDPVNQYVSGYNADGSIICTYFCPTPSPTPT